RAIMAEAGNAEAGQGICGVVAQMVEVPQEYERAVAAVLRDKLEYVMVSDVEAGLSAVEYLRTTQTGRGSFIPLTPRSKNGHMHNGNGNGNGNGHNLNGHSNELGMRTVGEGTSPLLDLVQVDDRYRGVAESLLGDAVLVSDLRAGLQL